MTAHPLPDHDLASSPSMNSSSGLEPPFFSSHTFVRKRVIYAHSDVLRRRSEYFATMLSSSFSENANSIRPGERKVYTITIEEADFVTVYWLLKWIYANWLAFRSEDDPRLAIEGIGAGWSAKWLNASGKGEWEWKRFTRNQLGEDPRSDARSVASATESAESGDVKGKTKGIAEPQVAFSTTLNSSTTLRTGSLPSRHAGPATGTSQTKPQSRQQLTTPSPSTPRRSNISSDGPTKPTPGVSNTPLPAPAPVNTHQATTSAGFTNSQRYNTVRQTSIPDPHPHPTPEPSPASALSLYQIAHRYDLGGLASLALEHMMTTIAPEHCFGLLLASSFWDELHGLVQVRTSLPHFAMVRNLTYSGRTMW